jgi:hypothetical protein
MATEILLKINADVKAAKKNIQDIKSETQSAVDGVGAFGITWGSVKAQFSKFKLIAVNGLKMVKAQAILAGNGVKLMFAGKVRAGAIAFFSIIKAGIAATGIGALVITFAALVSYFTAGEKGAAAFKKVTSAIGIVVGNVTDILSHYGEMLVSIATLDFAQAKRSFDKMADGVINFYGETKRELVENNTLQGDQLALQRFQRDAIRDKAEAEKDMMRLRMQAREVDKFALKERIGFLHEANALSEEQLVKDLHVAEEQLRLKTEWNSLNISSKEDLDEEARLEAAVFNVQTANFSMRKRMKMEIIALTNEAAAQDKAIADKKIANAKQLAADQKVIDDAELKRLSEKAKAVKESNEMLRGLRFEHMLSEMDDAEKIAIESNANDLVVEMRKVEGMENSFEIQQALQIKYGDKATQIRKGFADAEVEVDKARNEATIAAAGNLAGALSSLAGDNKALAVASATISTYAGATKALELGGPLGFVSAAAVIASGLGNIKKMLSTDVGSGTGGGALPSVTASAPAPQFSTGQFELQGGGVQQPIEAYVVTDSLTNSQDRLSSIRRRATI